MQYRYYQANAIDAGNELLNGNTSITNGIIVIPTGGGKSHVIAGIADQQNNAGLILQPSKEILEQNYQKLFKTGETDLGIYSASLGSKAIKKITFATIGSIYNKPELFRQFKYVMVDECDLVNHLGGMYKEFFDALNRPVLGMTASPWRLQPGRKIGKKRIRGGRFIDEYSGSCNQIVTRIKGKFFEDLIHITQIGELYENGFLCPLEYIEGFPRISSSLPSTAPGTIIQRQRIRGSRATLFAIHLRPFAKQTRNPISFSRNLLQRLKRSLRG